MQEHYAQDQDYIVLGCGAGSRSALYEKMQQLLNQISEKE